MATVRIYHKLNSLKTTEIYFLNVFEASIPRSMYQQNWCFLKILSDYPLHASLLAPVARNPWHSLTCINMTPITTSVFPCLCPLHNPASTSLSAFLSQGHLHQDDLIPRSLIIFAKLLFPNKITFTDFRV